VEAALMAKRRRRSSQLGAGPYVAFTRTWYRREAGPYGTRIVPGPGRKTTRERNLSYDEALRFCKNWNETHRPGPLSRKCEFTEGR
jgi:hypothetical protein